uniref:Uncharacterized protein n=1 Tax=Bactrocera latifrons TaxID=174628 RepID=A0A0K8W567_BACLA
MGARQLRLPGESFKVNLPNTRNQLPINTSLPHPILIEQSRSYDQDLKMKGLIPPHIAAVPTHVLAPKRKASEWETRSSQFIIPNNPDEPINLAIKQHHLNMPARSESEPIDLSSHAVDVPNENSLYPALHCEVTYDNDVEMEAAPTKPNKRKLSLDNNAIQEEPICLTNYTKYSVVNSKYLRINKASVVPINFSSKVDKPSAPRPTLTAIAVEKTFKIVSDSASNSDSISFGGAVREAFRTTCAQEKQIELYKIAHKITSKQTEPDDDVYIELGPEGTLVPLNEFKKIDWTNAIEATHDLLSLVFPMHVLETHGLSRKFTLPELDYDCKIRPHLDDDKVYDIKDYVTQKTKMSSEAFTYIIARRLLKLAKAKGYNPFEIS